MLWEWILLLEHVKGLKVTGSCLPQQPRCYCARKLKYTPKLCIYMPNIGLLWMTASMPVPCLWARVAILNIKWFHYFLAQPWGQTYTMWYMYQNFPHLWLRNMVIKWPFEFKLLIQHIIMLHGVCYKSNNCFQPVATIVGQDSCKGIKLDKTWNTDA